MTPFDEEKDKRVTGEDEDEGGSQGGSADGSQSGAIEFHDFVFTNDEKLSPAEEKLKLAEHKDKNGALIDKQKQLRDQREDLKQTEALGNQYGASKSAGSSYKKHPILANSAEFDGVDPQVNLDPNLNEAETNSEKKEELTYQYQKRYGLQDQPKFSPPTYKPGGF